MFLIAIFATTAVSLAVVLNSLRKAPEGYEDRDGFHVVRERSRYSSASVLPRRSKAHAGGGLEAVLHAGAGHFKN